METITSKVDSEVNKVDMVDSREATADNKGAMVASKAVMVVSREATETSKEASVGTRAILVQTNARAALATSPEIIKDGDLMLNLKQNIINL